jgi:hypothetical protein
MAILSKTQLTTDINADPTLTTAEKVILTDMVDSYQDLSQGLTTVQIAAIPTPANGLLVYNTDLSQFQYYNGVAWVGLAYGLGVPQTVKVTLSSAQLLDLANTPVDLIAAPGAGLSIVINTFTVKYTYGTVPYDFAGALYCGFSSIIASTTTLANVSNSALATTNNVSGSVFATTFGTTDRLVWLFLGFQDMVTPLEVYPPLLKSLYRLHLHAHSLG